MSTFNPSQHDEQATLVANRAPVVPEAEHRTKKQMQDIIAPDDGCVIVMTSNMYWARGASYTDAVQRLKEKGSTEGDHLMYVIAGDARAYVDDIGWCRWSKQGTCIGKYYSRKTK